jgi:hypothetical protein
VNQRKLDSCEPPKRGRAQLTPKCKSTRLETNHVIYYYGERGPYDKICQSTSHTDCTVKLRPLSEKHCSACRFYQVLHRLAKFYLGKKGLANLIVMSSYTLPPSNLCIYLRTSADPECCTNLESRSYHNHSCGHTFWEFRLRVFLALVPRPACFPARMVEPTHHHNDCSAGAPSCLTVSSELTTF